jgi:hypothetical protein
MKPQMKLRAIASGLAVIIITLAVCYLLTGLVATAAGYPMW